MIIYKQVYWSIFPDHPHHSSQWLLTCPYFLCWFWRCPAVTAVKHHTEPIINNHQPFFTHLEWLRIIEKWSTMIHQNMIKQYSWFVVLPTNRPTNQIPSLLLGRCLPELARATVGELLPQAADVDAPQAWHSTGPWFACENHRCTGVIIGIIIITI